MDYATSCAQQEITEAAKFLRWLLDEHDTTINDLRQDQLDAYLSEGTTTRTAVRNFIQWRARAGIAAPLKTRYRTARTTPLTPTRQRLELIKTVAEAHHIVLSTRIAALILLLYGTPIRKICELTRADVAATPEQTTIKIGKLPAPIPPALLPLFHQHLATPGNHRTVNHDSTWLFPGTNAGQHITEQMLMKRLRSLGIDITAAKNGALHDLIKEIDPTSLADLLGYTPKTMNIHATRAAIPMATYPAIKPPHRQQNHAPGRTVGRHPAWRMTMPLPASLQNSHRNGGTVFSSSWRILELYGCADFGTDTSVRASCGSSLPIAAGRGCRTTSDDTTVRSSRGSTCRFHTSCRVSARVCTPHKAVDVSHSQSCHPRHDNSPGKGREWDVVACRLTDTALMHLASGLSLRCCPGLSGSVPA
jgi:hypothetical protein